MSQQTAQVHDLGYRAFEGERAGVGWAMWSLIVHAVRRVFGLKRPAKHKIMPAISLLIAFAPAVVFVGLSIFLGSEVIVEGILPSYAEYSGIVGFAVILFAAVVAPDVISTDRRSGMLALYMASPLDRTTYIVSKMIAIFLVMLTMTFAPLMFLLLANTLAGNGPSLGGFFKLFFQIIAAGGLLSLFFTGISAAISSTTPRRGIASVIIVLALVLPTVAVSIAIEAGDIGTNIALLDFPSLPFEASVRLFGSTSETVGVGELSDFAAIGAALAYAVAGVAFTWWRYRSIEVTR